MLRFQFEFRFKKLVISSKVIEEIEIISLCKLDEILSKENYFEKSFLIDTHLISQNRSFSLHFLIDSDSIIYMIIHSNLVNKVCEKLRIQSISLAKEKLIRDYDEKISKKIITHKILLNLIIKSHKKLTVSMLIVDINHHEVILSKLWMKKTKYYWICETTSLFFRINWILLFRFFQFLSIQSTQIDRDQLRLLQSLRLKSLWCLNDSFEKSHSWFQA